MSGKPRTPAVSPAEELRELTREAHAAVKDLRQAIAQARALADQVTLEMAETMKGAANEEMRRARRHMQRQANESSRQLNAAVDTARKAIIRALTPEVLKPLPDGNYRVQFQGGNFDPLPVDLGEEASDADGPMA